VARARKTEWAVADSLAEKSLFKRGLGIRV